MKTLIIILISSLFFVSCGSKKKMNDADKTATESKVEATKVDTKPGGTSTGDKVSCMMKSDKREIQVKKQGSGCELAYSKFGNEEVVATSLNGTEHCQKIADRIQGNLENAGFKCE